MTTDDLLLRAALRMVCDNLRSHEPHSPALAYAEGVLAGIAAGDPPRRRRGRPRISEERARLAVDLYRAGATLEQTALQTGLCRVTVRACLERQGVPLRRKGPSSPERDAAIAAWCGEGRTFAEIGRELGLSRERVRQIVARLKHSGTSN